LARAPHGKLHFLAQSIQEILSCLASISSFLLTTHQTERPPLSAHPNHAPTMSFGGFNPLGGRSSNENMSPQGLRQQQIIKAVPPPALHRHSVY